MSIKAIALAGESLDWLRIVCICLTKVLGNDCESFGSLIKIQNSDPNTRNAGAVGQPW